MTKAKAKFGQDFVFDGENNSVSIAYAFLKALGVLAHGRAQLFVGPNFSVRSGRWWVTITPLAQPGNPKPRLFRLPEADALINRLGRQRRPCSLCTVDHVIEMFSTQLGRMQEEDDDPDNR